MKYVEFEQTNDLFSFSCSLRLQGEIGYDQLLRPLAPILLNLQGPLLTVNVIINDYRLPFLQLGHLSPARSTSEELAYILLCFCFPPLVNHPLVVSRRLCSHSTHPSSGMSCRYGIKKGNPGLTQSGDAIPFWKQCLSLEIGYSTKSALKIFYILSKALHRCSTAFLCLPRLAVLCLWNRPLFPELRTRWSWLFWGHISWSLKIFRQQNLTWYQADAMNWIESVWNNCIGLNV